MNALTVITPEDAVSAGADISLAVWDTVFPSCPGHRELSWKYNNRHYRLERSQIASFDSILPSDSLATGIPRELLVDAIAAPGHDDPTTIRIPFEHLAFPLALTEASIRHPLLTSRYVVCPDIHSLRASDVKFLFLRRLRQRFSAERSAQLARTFQRFSLSLNYLRATVDEPERRSPSSPQTAARPSLNGSVTLRYETVLSHLRGAQSNDDSLARWRDLFITACRLVGYIQPAYSPGELRINTRDFDAEYLLSHLFGMPTEIPGFDDLFGGGGLSLNDSLRGVGEADHGRAILIKGRFGTGKTLLALQLALEVARKGGAASYLALEQSPRDCLYSIESLGLLYPGVPVDISIGPGVAAIGLKKRDTGKGHLAISGGASASIASFLGSMRDEAIFINGGFKCIALDPVNAVYRDAELGGASVRAQFAAAIMDVKRLGVNVILVSEDSHQDTHTAWFEENIVDTVIHLSERSEHGYSRRVLEIQKSRLQREHRGRHVYSIQPTKGFSVFPSSAAAEAKIRRREVPGPSGSTASPFGLFELDALLGTALHRGDVITVKGQTGTHKSALAMAFLQTCDLVGRFNGLANRKALLITPRDPRSAIEYQINHEWVSQLRRQLRADNGSISLRHPGDIEILSLPLGYIHPGAILREIEAVFERARKDGLWIDRVVVENVAHWEMSCPFVREDAIFADVLVELFRSRRATTLFVCGEVSAESSMQRPIIDSADCLIELERFSFRGRSRVSIRVLKTRDSTHAREPHELYKDSRGLGISPLLLRESANGRYEPLPIRLFLHSESDAQTEYNSHWRDRLRTSLSRDVDVEPQSRINAFSHAAFRHSACIEEVHIYQLDEFELQTETNPATSHSRGMPIDQAAAYGYASDEVFSRMLPQCRDRCMGLVGCFAVPFYADVGFLAYRKQQLDEECRKCDEDANEVVSDWRALGRMSEKYAARTSYETGEDSLFFDFPHVTPENYNCLFLEVLFSFVDVTRRYDPVDLFRLDHALDAMDVFWQLGRPGYVQDQRKQRSLAGWIAGSADEAEIPPAKNDAASEPFRVSKKCVVWRHWFSTLNQMLSDSGRPSFETGIEVGILPGGLSVAGEWYLAVPDHSSAKSIAREIVLDAVSARREIDRLRRGVGLPVQTSFYNDRGDSSGKVALGPFIEMDLDVLKREMGMLVRRSDLRGYSVWNRTLSYHLQRILRISSAADVRRTLLRDVAGDLVASIKFLLCQPEGDER